MIKIDLEKAYDTVEWCYLEQVLEELFIPRKFIDMIMECLKTVNYSILINGEPTEPFADVRSLKQGDSTSSFIFVIAMEYLSRQLNNLKDEKTFRYHPKCAKLWITHLSFADDLLLMEMWGLYITFISFFINFLLPQVYKLI
ncbi:secreted RxLR effector protein 78-like [Nicotiana tabacum]|uniref:Secreted RxLR effector protein 78-like n=1 Tax=Nicotiana tabacum TaxID=4097 RepID=A0AC58S5D4_TOBAC